MTEDTICALATSLGNSGVSVIRISGKNSLAVAKKFFICKSLDYENIKPRYMYYGNFDNENVKEKCLMVYFKAPFSFTGEDIVEFQIHGGYLLPTYILNSITKEDGVRLSEPGEFSKRAFLNGKISLDEAESIASIISAKSMRELEVLSNLSSGALNKNISSLQKFLTDSLAEIEVSLDYPEHDIEYTTTNNVLKKLHEVKEKLENIIKNSENSKYINFGINASIVGRPNVGKSSLLNKLIGQDLAIVTQIAGTTRDIIKESISYKGVNINFIDTAGIRESDDLIESVGIEKSKESINKADIVLFVTEINSENDYDKKIYELIKNKKCIKIINKIDKVNGTFTDSEDTIYISAEKNINIESVKEKIYNLVFKNDLNMDSIQLLNNRHIELCRNALSLTQEAINCCTEFKPLDIIALMVKEVWIELGKITGETEQEQIIDRIFSKFCLGK